MNPVFGVKGWSVRAAATLLAALTSIFLTVGCGSTSLPKANNNGYSASNLTGTYVFSSEGFDSNGNFLTMAGAFTANGSGGITGGTMDVIDTGVTPASPVAQTITGGSYRVNTDGRGQVTLTSSVGSFTLDFVLTSTPSGLTGASSHGLISEFDNHGSGSGTLDLQTAVKSLSQLAGPYAFNFSGIDNNGNSFAATGAFTLGSNGAITTGIEDFNAGGAVYPGEALTGGPATLGSGTAPGSISLTTSSFALTFDFYPIDATHLKFIETDFTEALVGDAFSQTGASIPTGPMVFTMAGGVTAPIAVGGLMNSTNGLGDFTNGLEDVNDAGQLSPAQLQFTGTAVGPASTGGRVVVNLSGFSPAIQWVIYPSNGGLLLLETDAANVMQGVAYAQSATSLSTGTSVGYGLNLTGANQNGEIDDIAQFNATTATSNNVTGILDENDQGSLIGNLQLTGTYTPDSPATGRGSIVVPSLGTPLGGLTLEYYVVDGSTVLTIEADTLQVSAGSFELQTSSAVGPTLGSTAAAHRSMFVVHPLLRSRIIKLRKK